MQKINFIFYQVALIYILSLPLKAFFYSHLVFNFKIPERAFGIRLLLSLLVGTCIVPILIGFLMIIAALLIYLTVYILTVFPYEQIIFHREPPFPAKILFPYHFVFSHYVIIASYLFYLMKYRAYHVLTLLMAILSSGYFYKKSVINRIISSDLYERAQNETAAKNDLFSKLQLPEPIPAPYWFWPLAILSLSANALYLLLK